MDDWSSGHAFSSFALLCRRNFVMQLWLIASAQKKILNEENQNSYSKFVLLPKPKDSEFCFGLVKASNRHLFIVYFFCLVSTQNSNRASKLNFIK